MKKLMKEAADKNIIDKDEYRATAEIELRCVQMIANLWNAPLTQGQAATGCSTIGSSEACMLGGMALKWRWRQKLKDSGKWDEKNPPRPNIVMGTNVHVCWKKFATYWEVEPLYVELDEENLCLTGEKAAALCNENTIAVVAIMGSTYDGRYEDVAHISACLDKLQEEKELDIPIHVDAASGGFVAPFLQSELVWDFRLPRVASISCSGHKFGLVLPGVGWSVWRDESCLPKELVFECNYLGGALKNFALSFSRPGAQVVAQYYNLIRLGHEGYRRIHRCSQLIANHVAKHLDAMPQFKCLTHGNDIPVFAFTTTDKANFSVYDMSDKLREIGGWQVPAYSFPANRTDLHVLRIVCREGFSRDLADMLLCHIEKAIKYFAEKTSHEPSMEGGGFKH